MRGESRRVRFYFLLSGAKYQSLVVGAKAGLK